MAFYIKPPSGSVPLNKLQNFVMKRLAFLYYIHNHSVEDLYKMIIKESLVMNSECLIEGTVKDKISHFTLRLMCASSPELEDFFVQNETKLFSYRLQFCDFTKIKHMYQKASEHSKHMLRNNDFIFNSYKKLLKSFIAVAEALELTVKSKKSFIKVPFTTALKFVKERSHPLHLGYITIPLNDMKSLCVHMFEELLVQCLNQVKKFRSIKLQDQRMLYIAQKIEKWIHSKLHPVKIPSNNFMNECDLSTLSKKFPLCMQNLYNLLLKKHRLKHVSRVQFILFLKEIGIPMKDVIKLFMKEYSKPVVQTFEHNHASCSHNWAKNENRYIYSIEHLYGKRGACKNYRAHSCYSLQSSYDSEGGCPFVSFDSQYLQNILKNESFMVKDIEDITSLIQENKYHKACHFHLMCKINMHNKQTMGSNSTTINEKTVCTINFQCNDSENNRKKPNGSMYSSSSVVIEKPSDFYSVISSTFKE